MDNTDAIMRPQRKRGKRFYATALIVTIRMICLSSVGSANGGHNELVWCRIQSPRLLKMADTSALYDKEVTDVHVAFS